jgi:hypothetical protein
MVQNGFWWAAGGAVIVSFAASFAEWRRTRRRNLDRVGWVPWNAIQIFAWFATAILAILALKTG